MNDVPWREPAPAGRTGRIVKAGLVLLVLTVTLVFTPPALKFWWTPDPVAFRWASLKVATPPKIFCAQTILLFLGLLWLAKMNAQRKFVFHTTHLFWALVVLLGAQALSLTRAANVGYGLFELRVFLFWFLAYLLVTHYITERDIPGILRAIVIAGAIASIYGIFQYFGKDFVSWGVENVSLDTMTLPQRASFEKAVEALAQSPATFGHNNFAAHFLIIAIPVACAMVLTAKKWKTGVFYTVPLLLMVYHLNLTRCRGAVIGLGISSLLWMCIVVVRLLKLRRSGEPLSVTSEKNSWMRRWLILAAVIAGMALYLLISGKGTDMLEQFRRGVDTPYVTRTSIWRSSFRTFLDAPLLGVGKGNFEIATPPYWTEKAKDVYAHHLEAGRQAHNEYIEIAVETGIVGFGAFIWFLLCLGSRSLSLWKKQLTGERRTLMLAIVWAMTAVLVDSMVNFDLQTPACALSFFVLVGVIDVLGLEQEPRSTAIRLRERSGSIARVAVWVLLPVLMLLGALSIARPFLAKVRITSGKVAASRANLKEATRQFASAVRHAPWDWQASYKLASAYAATRDYDKAIEQFEASLKANPNYVVAHTSLGLARVNSGNIEKALESARRALALVPKYAMGHNVIGLCYMNQERWEEALEEFEAATEVPKDQRRQLHRHMAICHYKLGQPAEAVVEFDRAIEAGRSPPPELHVEKGSLLLEMNEYEKAAESLRTGIDLFHARKVQLASSQSMQKGYRRLAEACLRGLDKPKPYLCSWLLIQLSRSVPDDPRVRTLTDMLFAYLAQRGFSFEGAGAAWYHTGVSYRLQGRYDEAEKVLTLLIESGESNVDILGLAYHELALALNSKKDYDRALQTVDKGKSVAPDYAPLESLRRQILAEKQSAEPVDQP